MTTNNSKTFRLFISSTFSDFQVEREVLQIKVFPEIKEYCSSKGYTFQPIDLRWGVSNEAQLDQKALDMCIKEVQSCKAHNYPNFLIMLGDRYGWVPLPNIIEKSEFELILESSKDDDKDSLLDWYYEDKNQLPVSYMLKQREDEYVSYEKWFEVESKLRNIFQNAVSGLDKEIKNKYNTSATESEAIEGIVSYFTKTDYQKKLLELLPDLEQLDHKHIFGFFRDIDKKTIVNDKFVSDDYEKAQEFKEKVKSQLIDENILTASTSQISKDNLEESYLEKFTLSVTEFLKRQVYLQITKDEEKKFTSLEIENQQQYNYLKQKLENFLGQEKVLEEIQDYIDNDSNKPFIISGPSGIGKSCIMAKAIEDTSNTADKKIIYRFVGATPNSTTTTDLLLSILEEMIDKKESLLLSDNQDNLITFSDKIYDAIMNIKDNIVFFIDAVDQLTNEDQFLWLPNKLPSNIKIVISTLKDSSYKEDSKYFYILEDKISSYIEIEPFDKPIELLRNLLKNQKRTLQDEQKRYFLEQYNQVQIPLYISIAAYQIQFWNSTDITGVNAYLDGTQKGIIDSFISNLWEIHHHNRRLVCKVLGYILASKYGLSEYELLELLNIDNDFIKHVAPETWHINISNDLPLVIWTRLYNDLKPFLSKKSQDDQELLFFFHREFIDVIENQKTQKNEHIKIIEATQKILENNLNKDFDNNRWGKLYVELLLEYFLKYNDENIIKEYYDHIMSLVNDDVLLKYLNYISLKKNLSKIDENNNAVEHLTNILVFISNKYKHLSNEIYLKYIESLFFTAELLIMTRQFSEAIDILEQNIINIEALPNFNEIIQSKKLKYTDLNKNDLDINDKWLYLYFEIKQFLGFAYISNKDKVKSLLSTKETHVLFNNFYSLNTDNKNILILYYDQLTYYAMALQLNGVFFEAFDLLKDSLPMLEESCKNDDKKVYLHNIYAKRLFILSGIAFSVKDESWHQYYLKSYEVYENLMKYNFLKYSKVIMEMNNYYIENYNTSNLFLKSEHYYKYNIKLLNKQGKKGVEDKIKNISDDLYIKVLDLKKKRNKVELFFVNKRLIEYVFNFDKEYWAKNYVKKLIALGGLLNKSKIDDDQLSIALELQKEGVDICEQYMNEKDEWYDIYTKTMNNLANTYMYLNYKEESYLLNTKNLDISRKLFQTNQKKWFRAYYYALNNMEWSYFYENNNEKEKECKDKIKALELNPLFQTIPDVINSRSTDTKIKYFDYMFKGFLLLGIYFVIKYVIIE